MFCESGTFCFAVYKSAPVLILLPHAHQQPVFQGGEEARSVFGLGFEFHVGVVEVAEVYVEHILKIAYNLLYINRSLVQTAAGVQSVDKFHQRPFCPSPVQYLTHEAVLHLFALFPAFQFVQAVGEVYFQQFVG